MRSIEIVVGREGAIINPTSEHYQIGFPINISVSTRSDYRSLSITYPSKVPANAIDELARFANDYFLSQLSSNENKWKTDITINSPGITISWKND